MSADRGGLVGSATYSPRPSLRALSVVVPVHQGGQQLERVLAALAESGLARQSWELIVVLDASTDGSGEIAAAHADLIVRLSEGPRGPAYARNRGFEVARGALVAFVDADVLVKPDAIPRMIETITLDPTIGAVVGTYDASPGTGGLVSEYRNLLRHVEHEINVGDTDAFFSGLAIVRREAFVRAGMFDEWHFPRPQAEALEFGSRLIAEGYRIVRCAAGRATHLKQWSLRDWIGADLVDRGMSTARLNDFDGFRARAHRLYLAAPVDGVLAWTTLVAAAISIGLGSAMLALFALVPAIGIVLRNRRLFATLARARGVTFALAAIPLHLVTCAVYGLASTAGRLLYHAVGEKQPDAVTQALAEVGVRTWPPVPTQRSSALPVDGSVSPASLPADRRPGLAN